MQPRITSESVASLGSVSLLGEAAVDITAVERRARRSPSGATCASGPTAGSLADVATQASAGIEQLTSLLTDIRAGRGTIGQLFTNDRCTARSTGWWRRRRTWRATSAAGAAPWAG